VTSLHRSPLNRTSSARDRQHETNVAGQRHSRIKAILDNARKQPAPPSL